MNVEQIVASLESILSDHAQSHDPYAYRGMSERGASDELIAECCARDEGRDLVCDDIRALLLKIKEQP